MPVIKNSDPPCLMRLRRCHCPIGTAIHRIDVQNRGQPCSAIRLPGDDGNKIWRVTNRMSRKVHIYQRISIEISAMRLPEGGMTDRGVRGLVSTRLPTPNTCGEGGTVWRDSKHLQIKTPVREKMGVFAAQAPGSTRNSATNTKRGRPRLFSCKSYGPTLRPTAEG